MFSWKIATCQLPFALWKMVGVVGAVLSSTCKSLFLRFAYTRFRSMLLIPLHVCKRCLSPGYSMRTYLLGALASP